MRSLASNRENMTQKMIIVHSKAREMKDRADNVVIKNSAKVLLVT